jgi:predicted DNA-binding protein with PD1-like motif
MRNHDSGKRHILVLHRGEELMESLEKYARQTGLRTASVQGIAAAQEIVVGSYDFEAGKFTDRTFRGNFEINSIMGNISLDEGKAVPHIHIAASDTGGHCIGGHLQRAIISVTAELFLDECDMTVSRAYDAETRRRLWKL